MDWDLIWKAVLIVLGGTVLLRIAGRKSISQMTLSQTVIMIGIGSLLIQPIAGENLWGTLLVGLALVSTLVLMEYLQVKSDFFEKILSGRGKVLVKNGVIQEKTLKKCRLTVDQLEMNLRQKGVERIQDVEWATLEVNGRVALVLKEEARPVTRREFNHLMNLLEEKMFPFEGHLNKPEMKGPNPIEQETIFAEVERKSHQEEPPKRLH